MAQQDSERAKFVVMKAEEEKKVRIRIFRTGFLGSCL